MKAPSKPELTCVKCGHTGPDVHLWLGYVSFIECDAKMACARRWDEAHGIEPPEREGEAIREATLHFAKEIEEIELAVKKYAGFNLPPVFAAILERVEQAGIERGREQGEEHAKLTIDEWHKP